MANVNYSAKSIIAHLKDGTASITGEAGTYKLNINEVETQDITDADRDAIHEQLTAEKDAATTNKSTAGVNAYKANQQTIIDDCTTALDNIA